uniref:Uncharacterized protein n=1 Tax=Oryza glumipatula TaxID=40148 RepID=A0A0E0BLS7_9ORYZ
MNIPLPLSQLPLPLSRFLPLSRRRPGLARFSLPATTSPARPPLLSAISSSRPCHSVAAAPWWRLTEAPPQPPPSFDALLQIKEEIAGGHNGGVNLPGTCSFLMAFSTALHSQWILLRSACALTPVCWSLVKKCQLQWSNRFGKKCQSVQATGLGLVLLEQRFFMHGQAADSNESKSSGRCKFFLTGRSTMMPLF